MIGHLKAALFLFAIQAHYAAAQIVEPVSLQRITISGMPPAPGIANDQPHHGVEMIAGPNRVWFDSLYGGCVRFWFLNGIAPAWENSFVYPHMGAAMQVVYETGQDSTQGSATGITQNPIRVAGDDSTLIYNYYAREHEFRAPTQQDPTAAYEVRGFCPFFWISHGAIDDAVPTPPQSGWRTQYTDPPSRDLAGVTFDATGGGPQDGVFFVGDQWAPLGVPWNQRLVSIPDGRVAFKVKMDLVTGGTLSYGGVLFRKEVPTQGEASAGDALSARGYQLFVNRLGTLQLWKVDGGQQLLLDRPNSVPQASQRPIQLEVQTHNLVPGYMRVLVDDQEIGIVDDPTPILGRHTGLYTFADAGRVHFFDRRIYDVGLEFHARWIARPTGEIDADITVTTAAPEVGVRQVRPSAMGMWSNPDYAPTRLDRGEVLTRCGTYLQGAFLDLAACSNMCNQVMTNPSLNNDAWLGACVLNDAPEAAGAFWIGSADHTTGVYLTPLEASVDGVPAQAPFGGIVSFGESDRVVLHHLVALEFSQPLPDFGCSPHSIRSYQTVGRYGIIPPVWAGPPVVTSNPVPQFVCPGGTGELGISADGEPAVFYRWRRNGIPLDDGPTGWGSVISGTWTWNLQVQGFGPLDTADYDCVIWNLCGEVISSAASLSLCQADFSCDGQLNVFDFLAFQSAFGNGDPSGDFNGDGRHNLFDFLAFQTAFGNGC